MKALIALAVRRPITILMLFIGLGLFGVISAFNLGIDFLPEITVPRLVISTSYIGLPPEQIRELVTIPLEDALTSLKGIKKLSSISREGVSTIEVEFHWGINMDLAAVEAREIIDTTYPILPSDAKKPLVLPVNPGEIPVLTLAVFPVDDDLPLARSLAERELKTRLQQIDGVGAVILVGGRSREIRIKVDQALSAAKGITLDQIIDLLQQSNLDFPAGSFKEGITEYIVKTEGKVATSAELGELFITDGKGAWVKLKNITTISEENKERRSLFHINGREAVGLVIHRKGGMSPVTLSANVREELERLRRSYAADLTIEISKDSSLFISRSIRDLVYSALGGAAIAFLVLILFLRNLRISLILITSIPFSILSALLLLNLSGRSINIMSLGGLALGIGMLVDNSVVVLENLQKNLPRLHALRVYTRSARCQRRAVSKANDQPRLHGRAVSKANDQPRIRGVIKTTDDHQPAPEPPATDDPNSEINPDCGADSSAGNLWSSSHPWLENSPDLSPAQIPDIKQYVIDYTAMMAGSTFGSTLTSLVVFVPIIFLPGIIGALFTDLAISVAYSLLASYLVSVTLVPVLFSLTYRGDAKEHRPAGRIEAFYRGLLRRLFRRPWVLAGVILLLFIPGVLAFLKLNFEFMPDVDQREVEVTVVLPPGTSLEYSARVSADLAGQVLKHPQVLQVTSRAGGEENDTYYLADPESTREIIYMSVKLKEDAQLSSRGLVELLQLSLYIDEAAVTVSLPGNIITPLLGIRTGELLFQVTGENPQQAAEQGAEVLSRLGAVGDKVQLSLIPRGKKPQIQLIPDRDYIAQAGTTLARIAKTLGTAITGMTATKLTSGGKEIDVRVMLQESDRSTLGKLEALKIETAQGTRLALGDLVTLTLHEGTPALLREDRKDVTLVKAVYNPADQRQVQESLQALLADLPAVRSLETSELNQNLQRILLIFALVLVLLFLVLGAQFESFLLPLFLMLSLPLSFTGIFTALWLSGETLNLNSTLGILVLLGIVVNNSIVLFENYKQKIAVSKNVLISIYRGSSERIRPILITMFTTIMALLPIAIDIPGTQAQSSMAVAIIGGLFVSTTLTLFVTPLLFHAYLRRKRKGPL